MVMCILRAFTNLKAKKVSQIMALWATTLLWKLIEPARSFTVNLAIEQECIPVGCVLAAHRPYAGVCFLGGSACSRWGLPGPRGVSSCSRGCPPVPGGVCLVPGGCLPGLEGCLPGPGGMASQHALRQTPFPPVDRQTPVKTLPWPQLRCGR